MMEECGSTKHHDKNDNKTDTIMGTLDNGKEKRPCITSPNIMDSCVNKKHDD